MNKKNGFQLIELLIVLTLASILIGMIFSIGFRAVKDADYTGAVNTLIAEISFVKQLAASENRYVLMEFNNDGYSYSIKKQEKISDNNSLTVLVRSGSFKQGDYNKDFFEIGKGAEYSFVVNSIGMVFKKADITNPNPIPSTITIPVYFKDDDGLYAEQDTITITPSGGVHVKKTKNI